MPGDYSRKTFRAEKHYSGVLMQQGRVQLDADWNEEVAAGLYRAEIEATDVIGPCGVPKKGDGFKIGTTAGGHDLTISPGRIYADGMLCELEAQTTYTDQPYLPNPDLTIPISSPPASPPTSPPGASRQLKFKQDGVYLAFLDAWKREITALDDPLIREKALGGPDTTTRLQNVWQVKLLRVADTATSPPTSPLGKVTCETDFAEFDKFIAASNGKLKAQTKPPDPQKDPCLLPPTAGYTRLENQLYRVEVHTGGTRETATFKWSRDNASVETSIKKIDGSVVTVLDLGKDEVLGFAAGHWVEVVDDESTLKGTPHPLVQIDKIDEATRKITMKQPPTVVDMKLHPKLRRWDQTGADATSDGVKLSLANLIELEGGIEVNFSTGSYHSGDYWLIPARTATGDVEWPPYQIPNTDPTAQLPFGIKHHYCRLALLSVSGGVPSVIEDCREKFPPLTDICAEDVCFDNTKCKLPGAQTVQEAIDQLCQGREREPGIRITAVTLLTGAALRNDTDVPVTAFARGLRVLCDANLDQGSVQRKPVCFVTLDLPFPFNSADRQLWGDPVIGFQPLILAAEVNSDNNAILWAPSGETQAWLLQRLFAMMTEFRRGNRVLAHLTLKGNFIWAQEDPSLFLDGEAFGVRLAQAANTDVRLPSGDGRRGGDFEMWFSLVPPAAPPLLKINRVQILSTGPNIANPTPVVLGALTIFNPPSIGVPFTPTAPPNAIEVQFTAPPDAATVVAGQSFMVQSASGAVVPGQILFMPDNRTVRWVAQVTGAPGLPPGTYRVTLRGNLIASQGALLDGELIGLPSGNNTPGGDAVFNLGIG